MRDNASCRAWEGDDTFIGGDGDIIDLLQIDAIASGGDDAFVFIGDAAFSATAGELRFTATEEGLIVESGSNGDGMADLPSR